MTSYYGDRAVKVLDKGFVRFIDSMGDDLSIVRAARVSHDATARAGNEEGSDHRLVGYLWRNGHTTPFEAVTVTFEIKAPIFVFRQWHRHRTQSYNEVSARYTELPEEFYVPDIRAIGSQGAKHKQARTMDAGVAHSEEEIRVYEIACERQFLAYRTLLNYQWPRELARMVLPFSTYSKMFATASLLNWFRFIELRDHPHAQMEIQVYAQVMLAILRSIAPAACEAFDTYIHSGNARVPR